MNNVKAVAYIRVSTKEQDENVQLEAIKRFVRDKNMELMKVFIDKGESGAKRFRERPGAIELIKFIESNDVDAIIVFAIDRLGRSMLDTMATILEIEKKGVRVISIKEQFLQVLDDNIRKLILSILSWVAEFERRRIRERQLEAWAMGKQKGRPRKIGLQVIEKYIKKYRTLRLRSIWKIMKMDRIDISYETLRRRVKELGFVWYNGEWVKVREDE